MEGRPVEQQAPSHEQPPQEQKEENEQQQQQERELLDLSWANPPRPPFARSGDDNIADHDADADKATSTSTTTREEEEALLAARYASKLVEVRAVVTDSYFRGKDLAGKAEINDAPAVTAGGAHFACSRDPDPIARFLETPKLPAELEKWLDPEYAGE